MSRKVTLLLVTLMTTIGLTMAQERLVKGRVISSEDKDAVLGANVVVKTDKKFGAVTDVDGKFTIKVPQGAKTLVVSYIGFTTQEVDIAGKTGEIQIILNPEAKAIDELVVVGYGSGRKLGSVSSSVATVKAKDLESKPVANTFDALQGKVAGLQIYTSSGEPGQTSSVVLHGVGSLGASSRPLILLDGIPVSMTTLRAVNQDDFESVTVLKDASATSIYGARAANGVIVATTKRGKVSERASVTLRAMYGISNVANRDYYDHMMNREQSKRFALETGIIKAEQVEKMWNEYKGDTRWDRYYLKENRPTSTLSATITGGVGRTTYYLSASTLSQEGLRYRSGYDKSSYRLNLNTALNDWVTFGTSNSLSKENEQTNPEGGSSTNGALGILALPIYSPYKENGEEYYEDRIPGWNRYSPRYLADKNPIKDETWYLNSSSFVQLRPIQGLTLRSTLGFELVNGYVSSKRLASYAPAQGNGTARDAYNRDKILINTNTAEYKFNLGQAHQFTALLGHEFTRSSVVSFAGAGQGLAHDALMELGLTTKEKTLSSGTSESAMLSFFGRLSYDLLDKYYFDLTYRRDASSRFSKENRWAPFWAIGAMWAVKKENFLKDVNWLNDLRLRASAGTQGNSDIGNYQVEPYVGSSGQSDGEFGWGIRTVGNSALTWEKQFKATLGVETRLFNRLNLNVEVYHRLTSAMLMSVPYPRHSGFSSITENVGKFQNQGIDVKLEYDIWRNAKREGVSLYANVNYNTDKVLEIFQGRDEYVVPGTGIAYIVGQPISLVYPILKGVNPKTGRLEWYKPGATKKETVKDEVTDVFSSALEQNTGIRRYAPFSGGFGLNADYKGFFLQADFAFVLGKYLVNNEFYFTKNPKVFAGYNSHVDVFNYWKKEGDNAKFPSLASGQSFTHLDSGIIDKADFLRMKTLTLGYTIPKSLLNKQKIVRSAKLYITGRNLLTLTNFKGVDPETSSQLVYGSNPNTKQISFGIEVGF